ncbi:MAG: SRPBCC family protein [Candidatus Amulumruptor caecigallinarius]|nr:SRPBCC family protein [Candidatus Amulumruptor caecigallinarius]
MAVYKSDVVGMMAPAEKVFDKLSNLEGLGEMLRNVPQGSVPADKAALLDQIRITTDTVSFPAGPAGEITLRLAERVRPSLIRLEGDGTPVPLSMTLHIAPTQPELCDVFVEIDIQIPAMLKPMVNGPLQKMADQFAQMLRQLPM